MRNFESTFNSLKPGDVYIVASSWFKFFFHALLQTTLDCCLHSFPENLFPNT